MQYDFHTIFLTRLYKHSKKVLIQFSLFLGHIQFTTQNIDPNIDERIAALAWETMNRSRDLQVGIHAHLSSFVGFLGTSYQMDLKTFYDKDMSYL